MATLLLLTSSLDPSVQVLQSLGLLPHTVKVLPAEPTALIDAPEADVVLIDEGADPERALAHAYGGVRFSWPSVVGTPEKVRAQIQGLVDAGIDYVIVYLPRIAHDREPLHRFAREVIPHLA